MSGTEPKRRAWHLVEDAMVDDELERLAKLTPEQLEKELQDEGIDPAKTLEIAKRAIAEADRREEEAKERAAPTVRPAAKVVRLAEARAARPGWRSTPWLAAAAVLLVTLGFLAGRSPAIVALFNPPEPSATSQPTPREMMANLREKAFAACAQKDFGTCEMGLDEAQKTDPGGEEDARVVRARAAILRHKASIDCDRGYWVKCREQLDLAMSTDPDGENDADVKKMRAAIGTGAGAPTGTVGVKHY